jgi:transposase-like protein
MNNTAPASDPMRLDGLTPQQLLDEIRQIMSQFSQEVPGRRRTWPDSLKARVLALGRLGVPPSKIAQLSGVSRASVFAWCRSLPKRPRGEPERKKISGFVQLPAPDAGPVQSLDSSRPVVRLDSKKSSPSTGPSVTVRLPSGVEVIGLASIADIIALCREAG